MKIDHRLDAIYTRYNRLYFDGSLPATAMLAWDDALGDATHALASEVTDGGMKPVHVIRLNPVLQGWTSFKHLAILHEMAHIKIFPYAFHGKRFNDEMLRLASRGAFKGIW